MYCSGGVEVYDPQKSEGDSGAKIVDLATKHTMEEGAAMGAHLSHVRVERPKLKSRTTFL